MLTVSVVLFPSKLSSQLNTYPGLSASAFNSSLFAFQLSEVNVFLNNVLSALESLKPGRTDSNHIILGMLFLTIEPTEIL